MRAVISSPHTNRRIGCGTLEVRNYLAAIKNPSIDSADFSDAEVEIIGPDGGFSAVMYCEKEGFDPLFKAVNLANRHDLMIISNKGLTAGAANRRSKMIERLAIVSTGRNGLFQVPVPP